jgi:hypothetical protein
MSIKIINLIDIDLLGCFKYGHFLQTFDNQHLIKHNVLYVTYC